METAICWLSAYEIDQYLNLFLESIAIPFVNVVFFARDVDVPVLAGKLAEDSESHIEDSGSSTA